MLFILSTLLYAWLKSVAIAGANTSQRAKGCPSGRTLAGSVKVSYVQQNPGITVVLPWFG